MSDKSSNDGHGAERATASPHEPDAHGQAALLLIESLIHGLVARSIVSVEDAIEIIDIAAEVKEQVGAELGDSPGTLLKSLGLLKAISASLKLDIPRR